MHQLVNQVNDQLMTFEKMFDWIDEISKEARNFKIGISAVLLALISIMAVIAQLVSTIDINYQLDEKNRFVLILCGFVIGVLCTLAIYMLPITKRYTKLKFRKSRLD
jgi:NADH:ubiquinone oxidoreductase subunit 4 (subunit M)